MLKPSLPPNIEDPYKSCPLKHYFIEIVVHVDFENTYILRDRIISCEIYAMVIFKIFLAALNIWCKSISFSWQFIFHFHPDIPHIQCWLHFIISRDCNTWVISKLRISFFSQWNAHCSWGMVRNCIWTLV